MISLFKLPNYEKNFDEDIKILAGDIMALLKYDIAKIIMFNDDKSHIIIKSNIYKDETNLIQDEEKQINICKDSSKSLFKLLAKEKQAIISSYSSVNCYNENQYEPFIENIKNEIYFPFIDPNMIDEDIIGCLYLGSYDGNDFVKSVDLSKIELMKKLKYIQEIIYLNYVKFHNKRSFLGIIHILDDVTRARDIFKTNHHYNVANWSDIIAAELDFNAQKSYNLYIASILHDVGKLYIKESILNKIGKLSDDEINEMKKHCEYGFAISSKVIPYLNNIPEIIKCHHERYDGKGYPNGLKGDEIPLESRIIAIGDAVDAMLSYRTYSKPQQIEEVISEIIKNRGEQFDPEISDIMIKILISNKDKNDLILSKPIILGTVNILTKKETYIIKGNLIKGLQGYVFEAYNSNNLEAINPNEIDAIYFYTEQNRTIFEYNIKLESINKNRIYIANLTLKLSNNFFYILWDLNGVFEMGLKNKFDVNIIKISGAGLMFFTVNDFLINKNDSTIYKFNVIFEDGTIISTTGKIVNKFDIGYKNCYDFRFVNLKEQLRDDIIKQIFMRQATLRRGINTNIYSLNQA